MSEWVAYYIMIKINMFKPTKENPFVLGLPTGSSPLGTYKKLIEYYKEGNIPVEDKMKAVVNQKYYTAGAIIFMIIVLVCMYLILY